MHAEDDEPWKDPETLRTLYHSEGMNMAEIAEDLGCHRSTVSRQMDKLGVKKREGTARTDLYQDEEWLREKYVEEGLTQYELAELCNTSQGVISDWINEFGIIGSNLRWRPTGPVRIEMSADGYVRWVHRRGGVNQTLFVHRLLAVSEHGFDAVSSEMDIHHKNNIPWDNRPDNIEVLTRSEHLKRHRSSGDGGVA